MLKIISTEKNSAASRHKIKPGQIISKINGFDINDELDLFFHLNDIELEIELIMPDGLKRIVAVEKLFIEQDIGITAEPMNPRGCGCNCIFCFVSQMPKGLRKSLYFKDEDYRFSFLHGNYITGANLTKKDLKRIAEFNLQPLYISVHSAEPKLRGEMLGLKKESDIIPLMDFFKENEIHIHTQIVLCPGINDGRHLEYTINELLKYENILESIAVVPVGLTAHRETLLPLNPVSAEYAIRFLEEFEPVQKNISIKYSRSILFFSGEFYLKANLKPPCYKKDCYPQIENGVGMTSLFYEEYAKAAKNLPQALPKPEKVGVITSVLGVKVLQKALKRLKSVKNLTVVPIIVHNKLFGESVTVTGLLSGKDILEEIMLHKDCGKILLPGNCLKYPEEVFLDDITLKELRDKSLLNIQTVNGEIKEFFEAAAK